MPAGRPGNRRAAATVGAGEITPSAGPRQPRRTTRRAESCDPAAHQSRLSLQERGKSADPTNLLTDRRRAAEHAVTLLCTENRPISEENCQSRRTMTALAPLPGREWRQGRHSPCDRLPRKHFGRQRKRHVLRPATEKQPQPPPNPGANYWKHPVDTTKNLLSSNRPSQQPIFIRRCSPNKPAPGRSASEVKFL